jgi:Spy/CpxP family protein refolding chaperone
MKNKLYIALLAIIVLISANNICIAETKDNDFPPPPSFGHFDNGDNPPPPHKFMGNRPSKEEMEAKKLEFERRLNLTESQKNQIEADKQKDREIIKPIIERIKTLKRELHEIDENTTLSQQEKEAKVQKIKSELRELRIQANQCRKENMQRFEAVLTDKQKAEFSKIKEEQRQEMEKRRLEYEKQKSLK